MGWNFTRRAHRLLVAVTLFGALNATTAQKAEAGFIAPFTINADTRLEFAGFADYVCPTCVGGVGGLTVTTANWHLTLTEIALPGGQFGIEVRGQHLVRGHPELPETAPNPNVAGISFGPVFAGFSFAPIPRDIAQHRPDEDILSVAFIPLPGMAPDVSRVSVVMIHTPEPASFLLVLPFGALTLFMHRRQRAASGIHPVLSD